MELLKAPFLVLHFSYHTLMMFLMMLSVILISMLTILLSILSASRHRMCGKSYSWLRTWVWPTIQCRMGQEMDCWFQCWFASFNQLNNSMLLMWEWVSLFLKKNHHLYYNAGLSITTTKSTIRSCMGYSCHIWDGFSPSWYLDIPDKGMLVLLLLPLLNSWIIFKI